MTEIGEKIQRKRIEVMRSPSIDKVVKLEFVFLLTLDYMSNINSSLKKKYLLVIARGNSITFPFSGCHFKISSLLFASSGPQEYKESGKRKEEREIMN